MAWLDSLPLFDATDTQAVSVPYQARSGTSRAGAKAVRLKAGGQAQRVLDALQAGPRTLHELVAATGLPLATVCARVGYLRQIGRVGVIGAKAGPHGTPNTTYGRV